MEDRSRSQESRRGSRPTAPLCFSSVFLKDLGPSSADRDEMMSGIMTLSPQSRELVERAQRGDRAAFGELVEIHKDRIEALIEARLGKVLMPLWCLPLCT